MNPRLFAGCAAAAALLAGARLLWATLQSPFANGWDSYYFLAQFRGLWETGRFHTPDANLLYALLAPVYVVTGDAVLAYKLVLAASAAALIAGIITLARRLDAGPIIALAAIADGKQARRAFDFQLAVADQTPVLAFGQIKPVNDRVRRTRHA